MIIPGAVREFMKEVPAQEGSRLQGPVRLIVGVLL